MGKYTFICSCFHSFPETRSRMLSLPAEQTFSLYKMNDLYGTSTMAHGPCPYKACSKEYFSCTCLNLHSSEERISVGRMLPSSTQQGVRSARYSPNFMCMLLMKNTSYEVSGIYFYVYCKIDPWLQTYYCRKIFLSELIQRKNIKLRMAQVVHSILKIIQVALKWLQFGKGTVVPTGDIPGTWARQIIM